MSDKVWVLTCPCGWSRMVPRTTPTERRRRILADHRRDDHHEQPRVDRDIDTPEPRQDAAVFGPPHSGRRPDEGGAR